MELAIHMKNRNTGVERIKKVVGKDASIENWSCKDFFYGSSWEWSGTEPFANVCSQVKHVGHGYYRKTG